MSKPKLIIVDDEQDMAELVQNTAEPIGFQAATANSGQAFLKNLTTDEPDVIVLDLIMPGMDGIEVLQALAAKNSQAKIILMTGYEKDYLQIANTLGSAHGLHILGTLAKPFPLEAMETLLSEAYNGS